MFLNAAKAAAPHLQKSEVTMSPFEYSRHVVSFNEDDIPDKLLDIGPDDVISVVVRKPNIGVFVIPSYLSEVSSCANDWSIDLIEGVVFDHG